MIDRFSCDIIYMKVQKIVTEDYIIKMKVTVIVKVDLICGSNYPKVILQLKATPFSASTVHL